MRGGLGHRKFYLNELGRIESARVEKLPKTSYTDAQIEAGFEKLQRTFGFLGTLRHMEKETPYKRDELLKWSVAEFHTEFMYLAWESKIMKDYGRILKATKKEE